MPGMRRALALLLVVLAASCGGGAKAPPAVTAAPVPSDTSAGSGFFPSERVTVRFGGGAEAVRAEVAVTAAQLARGLMYRKELGEDEGMLFLQQILTSDGFYMKNTLIPLSIAYMRRTANRTYQVMAILDMEPCPAETVKCPTYPPGTYYDTALEMNKGWFERNDVRPGATAEVDGPIPNPFDIPSPTP